MSQSLTIIIPILNEYDLIQSSIERLRQLSQFELIFVDGGSSDDSVHLLKENQFSVLVTNRSNRGLQLYRGAEFASSANLLFLHLDTELPNDFRALICDALKNHIWGRFDVRLNGQNWQFRIIEKLMNLRSRWTGIATGDQAIFVRKNFFLQSCEKIVEHPIMEDIFLCRQLKRLGTPACIIEPVVASSRYWQKQGITKAVITMWGLRLLYFLGVSPSRLYKLYYKI